MPVPVLIVLGLITLGAMPWWPHSRGWGYSLAGMMGTLFVVTLMVAIAGGQV